VDWIAICVGLTGIVLQQWLGWAWVVPIAAIVLPSLLREIGVLKDGDEFLRGVAHRAAFHAMMCVVFLIMVTRILRAAGVTEALSPAESMKLAEGTFLVSYLLQYWGVREGSSRIFLGAAALAAVNVVVYLRPQYAEMRLPFLGAISGLVITLTGLSFLIRARPRLSACVLVALTALLTGFSTWVSFAATTYPQPWTFVSGATQFTLLFGCTGLALWRESRSM
jgi:hypothetical protein